MNNATRLAEQLTDQSVLGEWFKPIEQALGKVRFSDKKYASLPMRAFILFGCLRQCEAIPTLRETVQHLFHLNEQAIKAPVPRSTLSDAYASSGRRDILAEALSRLVDQALSQLPDKLTGVEGLGDRAVIGIDATYQSESSHYYPVSPSQGGSDNKKGHQHLTHFDMRTGIPLSNQVETQSKAEIRLLREGLRPIYPDTMAIKKAIYVGDRAFIDGLYWDKKKAKLGSTLVTRMKSNLNYTLMESLEIKDKPYNEGVIADHIIALKSASQPWRLIEFVAPDSTRYHYLTNDFDLEAGVIAFLYYRRWDIEKYFDNFKNDMANAKAWGKSGVAIEQQSLLAMITYILTRLFIEQKIEALGITEGDTTQRKKHHAKQERYVKNGIGNAFRAFYVSLSCVTCQMWRFLKNCFFKKSTPQLYERQFKPLVEKYL